MTPDEIHDAYSKIEPCPEKPKRAYVSLRRNVPTKVYLKWVKDFNQWWNRALYWHLTEILGVEVDDWVEEYIQESKKNISDK